MSDQIDHPQHYTSLGARCSKCNHPIECIDVVERLGFSLGNAVKYLWRAGLKNSEPALTDLKKAAWYIAREIARLEPRESPGAATILPNPKRGE